MTLCRSSHRSCFMKMGFLKISQNSQENIFEKIDSSTGVFLWILWNFTESLFYRIPQGNCFWLWKILKNISLFVFLESQLDNAIEFFFINLSECSLCFKTKACARLSFWVIKLCDKRWNFIGRKASIKVRAILSEAGSPRME